MKRRTIKRELDKLFSQYLRKIIGKCENCGRKDNLQIHHLFSRRYMALRYDPDNILVLCSGCHFHFHNNPLLWAEKAKAKLGEKKYNELLEKAKKPRKITNEELIELLEFLKKEV
jgi:5-methylcytosine-specific restriction endonuclease McrA